MFKKFTNQRQRGYNSIVSIYKRGQINLNKGALRDILGSSGQFIELFYDIKNRRVGIKEAKRKALGAIKVKVRGGSALITSKAFFDYYNILPIETQKFELEYNEKEDIYYIQLRVA